MTATVSKLETLPDPVRQARIDLAAAHRLANRFGYDDGIWNHFTFSVPGVPDRFLVKAHGLLMSEVTASNLIVVDAAGEVREGEGVVERSALCIHSKIHQLHPRADCVLHAHPPHATWLADLADGRLEMIDQDSLKLLDMVAYDDTYGGLAMEMDEGERIARAMGDQPILLSRNHGLTVTADSVALAFHDLHYMEHACTRQYRIAVSGRTAAKIPQAVIDAYRAKLDPSRREEAAGLLFEALKRELLAESPGFMD